MEPRALSEFVKRFRADNALPYLLIATLATSLVLFGLARYDASSIRWVFAGGGMMALVVALGLLSFVAIKRPGQLRTERHEQVMRYMDLLRSQKFDDAGQRGLELLIEDKPDATRPRRSPGGSRRRPKP